MSYTKENKLTSREYWNSNWKKFKIRKNALFFDVISKYLEKNSKKSCLEIGCVPGRFLLSFYNLFKYKIYGLDFSDTSQTKEFLRKNKVPYFKIFEQDFFKFNTPKRFDIVSSFGFIEHFKDYKWIFKRHVNLMKRRGILILEMPNFGNLQGKIHLIFDKKNYKRHNIKIMDLDVLRDLCIKNNLKILFLNYHKTIDFWIDQSDNKSMLKIFLVRCFRVLFKMVNVFFNFPNKQTSPYIILIAKKKKK